MSLRQLFSSIQPKLNIIFEEQKDVSITTTIVVPVSSSFMSSPFLSQQFQQNFELFIRSFFEKLFLSETVESVVESRSDFKEEITTEINPDETQFSEVLEKEDDVDNVESFLESKLEEIKSDDTKPSVIGIKKETGDLKNVQCQKCGKNWKNLEKHLKFCKGVAVPAVCQLCGQTYKSKRTLEVHMLQVHAEKIYQCNECDYKTGHKQSLNNHKQKVHGEKLRTHVCDLCGYAADAPISLRIHMETHQIRKRLTCQICGKTVLSMKSHLRAAHNNEMATCDICGKEFRKVNLRKHKKSVHSERQYPCTQCSYKGQTNFNLKLHISKSHLGIKEMAKEQCPHCDTKTTNLERHVRIHHPEK